MTLASIADAILGLHGAAALAVVFLLPALESSAFVGFVFPGEVAVLLGGVLAYQHKVSLPAVLAVAIAGAIVGDSIGYEVGKRWGRGLVDHTVGRFVKREHLERAERYLAERGGKAVFLGRFTAALRVLIPGLAGMSGLRYRTFLAYNATGGALWAGGFVVLGYLGGGSWKRVESIAGRASLVLLLLVVVIGGALLGARWIARHQQRFTAFVSRQLERPLIATVRERFRRELDFLARRLRPGGALGLSFTAAVVAILVFGWLLGIVVRDVVVGSDATHVDRPVLEWFAEHRSPWLTELMKAITTLGSTWVLVSLAVVVGGVWWLRRRTVRPLVLLVSAYLGADLLDRVLKVLTDRPRPPLASATGQFGGLAFPSGHAADATAVFGMLAVLLVAVTPSWPRKVGLVAAAFLLAVVVGVSRLYLGAHWLTDVLGGWALGATWLALLVAAAAAAADLRPGRAGVAVT